MEYMNTMWPAYNNYFCVKLNVNMFIVFVLSHSDAQLNVAWLSVAGYLSLWLIVARWTVAV